LRKTWLQSLGKHWAIFFFTFVVLQVYRYSFGSLQGVLGKKQKRKKEKKRKNRKKKGKNSATGKLSAILVPVARSFQNTSSELLGSVNTQEGN